MQCTNIVAFVNHQTLKELKNFHDFQFTLSFSHGIALCNCAIARKHFHLFRFLFRPSSRGFTAQRFAITEKWVTTALHFSLFACQFWLCEKIVCKMLVVIDNNKTRGIIMMSGKRMAVKRNYSRKNRTVAQSLSNDKKLLQHTLFVLCQSDEKRRFLENKNITCSCFIAPKAARRQ